MHTIATAGRHNYVSNYSYRYCRIPAEGFLYDTERDLSAISKFLV